MFGWLKRKSKQPPDKEMRVRVARALDEFIQQHGIEEFSKDRLSVVVEKDFSVKITESSRAKDALVTVPFTFLVVPLNPTLRMVAIDTAQKTVLSRLELESTRRRLQLQSK